RCHQPWKPPSAVQEFRWPAPVVLPARVPPPAPRPLVADTPESVLQQIVCHPTGFLGAGFLGAGFLGAGFLTILILTASVEPARAPTASAIVRSDPWFRHWRPRQPWLAALRSPR